MHEKSIKTMQAREIALRALVRVEQDGAYLNLFLPVLLQGITDEERSLAVKLATGTLQRLNTIDWAVGLFAKRSLTSLTPWIRNILRMSAYQLLYLDRVPDYAVVDEGVRLARRFGHHGVAGLVNALLRRLAREAAALPWPERDSNLPAYLSLYYSHPEWLISRWLLRYGYEETARLCQANNEIPPLTIRPNLMRTTPEILRGKLQAEGVDSVLSSLMPGMLQIVSGRSPAGTDAFREGLFTIQGESSALVAPLLAPQPGDTVLDLCSAPGGKTTHLAELMEDNGRVIAVDLHRRRLQLVIQAARRLGLTAIEPVLADGRKIHTLGLPIPGAILVDAPCSGLGVIRRLPEIKWRRDEEELAVMQKMQLELLSAAAAILPARGKLLYSVCTNEPEETEDVARAFTQANRQFSPAALFSSRPTLFPENQQNQSALALYPHTHGLDGFFITMWTKH